MQRYPWKKDVLEDMGAVDFSKFSFIVSLVVGHYLIYLQIFFREEINAYAASSANICDILGFSGWRDSLKHLLSFS